MQRYRNDYKYSKEDYYKLLNADCLNAAQALGLQIDEGKQTTSRAVHIKNSGGLYIFPDNNNWYRHADGAKGFAVDLVMDIMGCDRDAALDFIARNVVSGVYQQTDKRSYKPKLPLEDTPKTFVVPAHDVKPSRVPAYLIKTRGIDKDIVYGMINRKMIAEDAQRHNCLFFGRDQDGTIKSCAVRGTGTVQFRGEVAGGNKSYSFAMNGSSDILRLFESPIDAMSHASFSKALGKDWTKDHRLSTNGCGYQSVLQYLTDHKDISRVWICYDNDQPGRKAADETAAKLRRDFPNRNLTIKIAYPQTKDWNEDLQQYRKLSEQSNISAADFVRGAAVQLQETPAAEPEAEEDEEDECMEM